MSGAGFWAALFAGFMAFFGTFAGAAISGWYAARLADDERKIRRHEQELEKWRKKEEVVQDFIWIVTLLEMKTERYKKFFENTQEKVNFIYPLTFSDECKRLEQNRILFLGNHKMEIAIDELKQRAIMAEVMTGRFIEQFLEHHTRPDPESLSKYVDSSQKVKRDSLPVFHEELSKIEAVIRQKQSEINRILSEQPQTLWDIAKMAFSYKEEVPDDQPH